MTRAKKIFGDDELAKSVLKEYAPPGTIVYTGVVQWDKRSNNRRIKLMVHHGHHSTGELDLRFLARNAAILMGWEYDDAREAISISGAGLDLGQHLVENLSNQLYGKDNALRHAWLF